MRALPLNERAESKRPLAYVLPILIVEDDQNLLRLYKLHLQKWPFEVQIFTAANGFEALVLIGEVKPALLICDLRLPGVTGFQVVRAICNMTRFKEMRLAVISGLPAVEIEAHGGFSERVEVMGKPIDFERLRDIAQAQWQRKCLQQRQHHEDMPALSDRQQTL